MTRSGNTPIYHLQEVRLKTHVPVDNQKAFAAGVEAGIKMFSRVVNGKEVCGSYGWEINAVLEDVRTVFLEP